MNKTDYLIPEILENASKFENRDQRISYLREYISHPLREVLKLVFDDRYVFSFDDDEYEWGHCRTELIKIQSEVK